VEEVTELVHLATERGIATITLDSPANRNALSQHLMDELVRHLDATRDDGDVRGVILTATGTTFCSGADLRGAPGSRESRGATLPQVLTTMLEFPKALVVALNGHVRAGGIGLVAAADIVVAPEGATFAFTEVTIGVAPAVIGVVCSRRMTPRSLSRYCITGEVFGAEEACDAGLVTIVVSPSDVDGVITSLEDAIRRTEPTAVRATKELLRTLPTTPLDAGFVHAAAIGAQLFASEAAAEGMLAFRERRPPRWAG
jgi:enoyl-CoA hydratase/carnithine racemase